VTNILYATHAVICSFLAPSVCTLEGVHSVDAFTLTECVARILRLGGLVIVLGYIRMKKLVLT
jgi:hypothetical protein